MNRRIAIYIVCLIPAVFITLSILSAPLLIEAGGFLSRWGMVVDLTCKGLCHQAPERSYYWDGVQFAVCHRCTGIYAGALLGLLAYPFTPHFRKGTFPSTIVLIIFMAPVFIDIALGLSGIWGGHPYVRTITGGLAGFIGAFYAVPGIDDMIGLLRGRKK
jgi:uncharacterized membrane protein